MTNESGAFSAAGVVVPAAVASIFDGGGGVVGGHGTLRRSGASFPHGWCV